MPRATTVLAVALALSCCAASVPVAGYTNWQYVAEFNGATALNPRRWAASFAYDPAVLPGQALVVGGLGFNTAPSVGGWGNEVVAIDTATLLPAVQAPAGPLPATKGFAAGALVTGGFVWAGGQNFGVPRDDASFLNLTGGLPGVWQPLPTMPGPRAYAPACSDATNTYFAMVGGGSSGTTINSDVNVLSFAAGFPTSWSQATSTGDVRPVRSAVMVQVPGVNRFLLMGGMVYQPSFQGLNTVTELTFDATFANVAWREMMPAGAAPSGRAHAAAFYEPNLDTVFFGYGSVGATNRRADIFGLDLQQNRWFPALKTGNAVPYRIGVADPVVYLPTQTAALSVNSNIQPYSRTISLTRTSLGVVTTGAPTTGTTGCTSPDPLHTTWRFCNSGCNGTSGLTSTASTCTRLLYAMCNPGPAPTSASTFSLSVSSGSGASTVYDVSYFSDGSCNTPLGIGSTAQVPCGTCVNGFTLDCPAADPCVTTGAGGSAAATTGAAVATTGAAATTGVATTGVATTGVATTGSGCVDPDVLDTEWCFCNAGCGGTCGATSNQGDATCTPLLHAPCNPGPAPNLPGDRISITHVSGAGNATIYNVNFYLVADSGCNNVFATNQNVSCDTCINGFQINCPPPPCPIAPVTTGATTTGGAATATTGGGATATTGSNASSTPPPSPPPSPSFTPAAPVPLSTVGAASTSATPLFAVVAALVLALLTLQ